MNPGERRASPIEQVVLLPGTRRLTAAPAGADEPGYRVIVGERRYPCVLDETRTRQDRRGRHKTVPAPPDAWKLAALNQAPDRRPRHAQRPAGFIDGEKVYGRSSIRTVRKSDAWLTKRALRQLFAEARLYRERFFGLTKSFIADHGWD